VSGPDVSVRPEEDEMNNLPPPDRPAGSPPPPPPPYAPPGFPQQAVYVVQHQTKYGVGGWLAFFVVMFVLGALTHLGLFFALFDADRAPVDDLIFNPLIGLLCVASVVLIAMKLELGRIAAIATIAATWSYGVVNILAADGGTAAARVGGIVTSAVFAGAVSLYFVQSDRVRQTLVR